MKSTKLTSLASLKGVKQEIETRTQQEALAAAERARVAAKLLLEKNLFINAAGAVNLLPDKRRAVMVKPKPEPIARQAALDNQAVLIEAISDEFDVGTLMESDEHMSYRRPGIGTDITRKLRRGDWSIQRQLDLHGLRRDDARETLSHFIREAHRHGIRCVRVVHGKGLGSLGKAPILKSRVQSWLVQKKEVLAFVQAKPAQGGAGALVVLLTQSPGTSN